MSRRIPTDYYSRQASKCASAALAATIAEIKEAYLNLEQGWLYLAPDAVNSRPIVVAPAESPHDPASARPTSAVRDANRQQSASADRASRDKSSCPAVPRDLAPSKRATDTTSCGRSTPSNFTSVTPKRCQRGD
jgi:hypothetical protein